MADRGGNRCATSVFLVVLGVLLAAPLAAHAGAAPPMQVGEFADAEIDDCLDCHDETEKVPVLPILATAHAVKADERTPLAQTHECQTCHGPSAEHMDDESVPPAIVFGPDAPAGPQNDACLSCHQGGDRINWQGSIHASSNIACVSCHKVHVKEDPVMAMDRTPDTPVFRSTQSAVCFQCHQNQRADIHKASAHPVRDGLMDCSDCHNTHGSMGPTNLTKPTLNETCYQCHAEKRGPFLWEHAPVAEDCSICHRPHGSNHPMLLVQRQPQVCEVCHAVSRHPSTAYEGPDPGMVPIIDRRVGAKSCLNCHTRIHGSNHPSGARLTR